MSCDREREIVPYLNISQRIKSVLKLGLRKTFDLSPQNKIILVYILRWFPGSGWPRKMIVTNSLRGLHAILYEHYLVRKMRHDLSELLVSATLILVFVEIRDSSTNFVTHVAEISFSADSVDWTMISWISSSGSVRFQIGDWLKNLWNFYRMCGLKIILIT